MTNDRPATEQDFNQLFRRSRQRLIALIVLGVLMVGGPLVAQALDPGNWFVVGLASILIFAAVVKYELTRFRRLMVEAEASKQGRDS